MAMYELRSGRWARMEGGKLRRYRVGDAIELSEDEARPLVSMVRALPYEDEVTAVGETQRRFLGRDAKGKRTERFEPYTKALAKPSNVATRRGW